MGKKNLKFKVELMDENAMKRALTRLSYEIVEKNPDLKDLCLIGIKTRGIPMANRLCQLIEKHTGTILPYGSLDIRFYRDDLQKVADSPQFVGEVLPFDITGKKIILVDDVLYTGRTVRAAIDALFDAGRPQRISLAVLVDRGHRELPFKADYVGKNVPTSNNEVIAVSFRETDGKDNVELLEKQ